MKASSVARFCAGIICMLGSSTALPEAFAPRESLLTDAIRRPITAAIAEGCVHAGGSGTPGTAFSGQPEWPAKSAAYAGSGVARRSLYSAAMTNRRMAILGIMLAGTPAVRTTAQDRGAYARYETELHTLLSPPTTGAAAPSASVAGAQASEVCPFLGGTSTATSSQECMSCHGLHQTHPIDIDYVQSSQRRPDSFRTLDEVVRRGVYLPDGQVKCTTCHDPRSPWKYRLAVPPGTVARPAVNIANPSTFERTRKAAQAPLPPGSAVTPTPLCLACHAYD